MAAVAITALASRPQLVQHHIQAQHEVTSDSMTAQGTSMQDTQIHFEPWRTLSPDWVLEATNCASGGEDVCVGDALCMRAEHEGTKPCKECYGVRANRGHCLYQNIGLSKPTTISGDEAFGVRCETHMRCGCKSSAKVGGQEGVWSLAANNPLLSKQPAVGDVRIKWHFERMVDQKQWYEVRYGVRPSRKRVPPATSRYNPNNWDESQAPYVERTTFHSCLLHCGSHYECAAFTYHGTESKLTGMCELFNQTQAHSAMLVQHAEDDPEQLVTYEKWDDYETFHQKKAFEIGAGMSFDTC
eukprot:gnl/TRDRNA2_/TRDRNA2_127430_c0_seq1.p1 gnl/TRDRNA2_/TRDRNA2_127430_c0~~gnl/TRDRNA2_/TRDRNA2_127430_c0_seq1.p1  ORF type:complete len:312 (+),score=29.88 gnl/TRDRNA2_/TRDRNA2_127430_c0_seq1:41-937(+)